MKGQGFILLCVAALLIPVSVSGDGRGERENVPPVSNETYRQACGSCHFAYQPGLLPASSWKALMDDPGAHPGGPISLDPRERDEIRDYLLENSAEKSPSKRSRKILRYAGRSTGIRVSENPYIREKHDDIGSAVFGRKSIGSRANCPACHRSAERGYYDDDDVVIPR